MTIVIIFIIAIKAYSGHTSWVSSVGQALYYVLVKVWEKMHKEITHV